VWGRVVGFLAPSQKRGLRRSSLDSNIRNLPKRSGWSAKQKRAYQRLLSGLTRAKTLGKKVRFMTLTSSPNSSFSELNEHFQVLRKRIKRKFGVKIDYIKFKTNEGYGVLHVIFVGSFIPQQWLSRNWEEIHGAKIVDVREVRGEKRLARYLISNYLVTQTFVRMSWSWGWVFRGFVSMWKWFVRKFGYPLCIRHWTSFLSSKVLFWKQKGLFPELGSKAPYPWVRDEPHIIYGKF
jgi:hypothetical protein